MFKKFVENNVPINQQEGIYVCGKDDQRHSSIVFKVKNIHLFVCFGVSLDLYDYLLLSCSNEYFYPVERDY